MDGEAKLNEAKRMLANLDDAHGRQATVGDTILVLGLLADAMSCLPDWVWDRESRCPPGPANCD